MKLLFIGNFIKNSKAPSPTRQILQHFRLQGHEVAEASPHTNAAVRLGDMLLTALFKARAYDLVILDVFSGRALFYADLMTALLAFMNKKIVLCLHGGSLPETAKRQPEKIKRILARADTVTTPSRYLKEELGFLSHPMIVIPNAVPLSDYVGEPLKEAKPNLLWLRAFHAIYNPMMAVHAASLLRDDFPNLNMLMIGPDKQDGTLDQCKKLIEEQSLGAHIQIIEGVEKKEVSRYMKASDIFVNTSEIDNMPVSVVEAMAAGRCIVSTNVGGIPFLLEDQETAVFIEKGDAQALAQAVRKILENPAFAHRLSARSSEEAKKYSRDLIMNQWESVLASLYRPQEAA